MFLISKIAYNVLLSVGARVLGVVVALINIGFITRYLGVEVFGEYMTVLAFVYTFSIAADLGLYSILIRDISRPMADEEKIVGNIFSLRLFSSAVILAVAIGIGFLFPYNFQVKSGIIIGAFSFFFLSCSQVLVGIFQKYLKISKLAIAEFSGRVVNLVLVLIFIYLDLGFLWIILALTLGSFVNFLLAFLYAKKIVLIKLRFDFVFWKKIFKESLPIAASIVLTLIYFKLDTILLSVMKPPEHVGIYGLAYKVLESMIFFPAMFVGLVMPMLSRYAVSDISKFKILFQKSFDILLILAIPIIAGIILLARPIIMIIGGIEFVDTAPLVLQILSVAIGIIFLGSLLGNSVIALGRQKTAAWIYGGGAIFNIIANIVFIPKYSYVGAAFTTIFTELIVTFLMAILIYKTISLTPSFGIAAKAFIGASVMYFILYFFSEFNLLGTVLFGILIYFLVIYAFGAVTKKDILMLIRKSK